MSDTGIVSVGMSVARQLWRNTNITSTTRPTAISSVSTTSLIDSCTTMVVSKAMLGLQSRRERLASAGPSRPTTPRCTSSALAVGSAEDAEAHRVDALEAKQRRVGLGAQLHASRRP